MVMVLPSGMVDTIGEGVSARIEKVGEEEGCCNCRSRTGEGRQGTR